jgi:hypothetical protein
MPHLPSVAAWAWGLALAAVVTANHRLSNPPFLAGSTLLIPLNF